MLNIPLSSDLIHGLLDLEPTDQGLQPHRLPAWARGQCPDPQLAMVEAQPAGGRLSFDTDATIIELDAWPMRRNFAGLPPRPVGVYDLLVDGVLFAQASVRGGEAVTVDMATGQARSESMPAEPIRFDGLPEGNKRIDLWLPHNETTRLRALRANAPVTALARDGRTQWLHYGSSISQGSNAASPTGTWPAVASLLAGVDLMNLGLGGSALLDPFVARTIRDQRADVISLKVGINLVNMDAMRMRAFAPAVHGFIDTIRDGHPTTPLLIVSPILCPIHEDTPGPGAFDIVALQRGEVRFRATGDPAESTAGKLTLNAIRSELHAIVDNRRASDPNLFYLDGRRLYGDDDSVSLPLPDALHPDAATHQLMGRRFTDLVFARGGLMDGWC